LILLSSTKQNLKLGLVALILLISLNFWSFRLFSDITYRALEVVALGAMVAALFFVKWTNLNIQTFKGNVLLFIIIPLISGVSALLYHDQPYILSLIVLRTNFFWLFYFLLHGFNLPKRKIINVIVVIGLVWIALTILQQFTYPRYYFYSRTETDKYSIYRSGVYRFMIFGQHYGTFVLLYFYYRFLMQRKAIYLVFVILGLAGLYYYGTRQFAISAALCILLTFFFVRGRARWYSFVILLAGISIGVYYRDALFGQYIELTTDQFSGGKNIRELSADFWLNEYWPNWLTKILGNGTPHIDSPYGQEMEKIRDRFFFYRSDVGIIGTFNEFGLIYVINVLWVIYNGIRSFRLLKPDRYIGLLSLNALILLPTTEYFSHIIGIPFYCLLFYLFDKSKEELSAFKAPVMQKRRVNMAI
jgi:hypothetical protein